MEGITKDIAKMQELARRLDKASKAYYQQDNEIISNYEYDHLYEELVKIEQETGIVVTGSPTMKVGYEAVNELPKEAHLLPMLSLDKTKEVDALKDFIGFQEGILSWKLDGLTIVLSYENGHLVKAVTRGNGEIGEVITNNAKVFCNVPLQIPYKGSLVIRGEAVINYDDFEKINAQIEDLDSKYKNPRNLCSGSVRQLNNEVTKQRMVKLYVFSLVKADDVTFNNSREEQLKWMQSQGFEIVEYQKVSASTMDKTVAYFAEKIENYNVPSDGLVLLLDDIAYGESLGRTAKFPRDAIAFKWADEIRLTKLLEIEWSPSRTGLINPVAIFEPVELEGTTVSRASVHNLSIMKELALGIGDEIGVYKANMIIPQIGENYTRSGVKDIPSKCPACQEGIAIKRVHEVESLYCTNPECSAKKVKGFSHFVSRNALNIEGLSEATLEKLIGKGFLRDFSDLYHLQEHREEIIQMEGFKEKSYENLIGSIEKSRKTQLYRVIYSLGIKGVGLANAKMICKAFEDSMERMEDATLEELSQIDGVGELIGQGLVDYFSNEKYLQQLKSLLPELQIERIQVNDENQNFKGQVFVITGSLALFENRDALKTYIEAKGGKVTGSVTSKTTYLINNDTTSNSSKNKKAKELGIPIWSETDLMEFVESI